jgi:hypothetical protein
MKHYTLGLPITLALMLVAVICLKRKVFAV